MLKDRLYDSLLNKISAFAIEELRKQEIKKLVKEWIERQRSVYETLEVDFEGFSLYLLGTFVDEMQDYLHGDKSHRDMAKKRILTMACTHASAANKESQKRIEHDVLILLELIDNYSKKWIGKEINVCLREIEEVKELVAQLDSGQETHFEEKEAKAAGNTKRPVRMPHYVETDCDRLLQIKMKEQRKALILGMPGIGKTEGALWHLEQVKYEAVVWLDFATQDQALGALADYLAQADALPKDWNQKEDRLKGMLHLLERCVGENAVVIFDNVNDRKMLKILSEIEFSAHEIIISCLNSHFTYFKNDIVLHWKELKESDCEKLFFDILGEPEGKKEPEELQELMKMCEGIPLIVRQAAAYIMASQISLSKYIGMCKKMTALQFERESAHESWMQGKNADVYMTFRIPYQTLCAENNDKDEFLRLLNTILFLSPDSMTENLLLKIASLTYRELNDGMYEILKYSLIRRNDDKIFIKQVVQDIMRSFLDKETKEKTAARVGSALAEEFSQLVPISNYVEEYTELGSNAISFLDIAKRENITAEREAELLQGIGCYYYLRGLYALACQYMQQALNLADRQGDRILYLRICGELAEVYEEMGNDTLAGNYLAQVARERETLKAHMPLAAAQSLIVEAFVCQNQKKYEQAWEKLEQAQELLKNVMHKDAGNYRLMVDIAKINNLNETGQYLAADGLLQNIMEELSDKKEVFETPLFITLVGSSANTWFHLGKLKEALSCYMYQFFFYRKYYRNDYHPIIIYACMNIELVYMEWGEYKQAEEWLKRAEKVMKEAKISHPERYRQIYSSYSVAYYAQGNYVECCRMLEKMLKQGDLSLEMQANIYLRMAYAKYGLQQWDEAKQLLERVDSIERQFVMGQTSTEMRLKEHEILQQRISGGEKIEDIVQIRL